MRNDAVSIEVSRAGGTNRLTGRDVLDWRQTSIIHKAWERQNSGARSRWGTWFPRKRAKLRETEDYTLERHHNYNGRPWCLGRDHFEYLLKRGLSPSDYFLDLGCGAMRTGVWVASYLQGERYYGIDAHLPGLEAAARYEIPLHGLQRKKPRLLNNDFFDIGHFGVRFDWIFSFAVINHLSDDLLDTALRSIHKYLKPSGRVILSPVPRKPFEWIEGEHGLRLCHSEETPCLFIDDKITWFEFQKI